MAENKPTTKKAHYVPQFYLNNFSDSNGQLFAFDKVLQKSYQTRVADIAQERFFYDIPDTEETQKLGLNPQLPEAALSRIEGFLSPTITAVIRRIERRKYSNIFRPEHRKTLAVFLALQVVRTKEFRVQMVELTEKAMHSMMKPLVEAQFPTVSFDDFEIKLDKKHHALHHDAFIFDFEHQKKIAAVFYNHIWRVGINGTKQPIYVSDNPVVKWNPLQKSFGPFGSNKGVASLGIEIALPLSPKYILIMVDRFAYAQLRSTDGTLIHLSEDNITYYNSLQVQQSYRQIYCTTDSFGLAREICKDLPAINNPTRPRFEAIKYPAFPKTF